MSRQLEVREGEQLPGGREIAVTGCLATRGDEQQNREVPIRECVKVFPP